MSGRLDAFSQPNSSAAFSDLFATGAGSLFGREAELAWITDQLERGTRLLVIYGARRIGKTALLQQLVRQPPDGHLVVYLDACVAGGRVSPSSLLQMATEVSRSVREQAGLDVEPSGVVSFVPDPVGAWRDYLGAVLSQLGGRKLVLLVDNADRATPEWLDALLQAPTPAVLTAQDRGHLVQLSSESSLTLASITLGPLDHEAAEALVKSLVAPKTQIDPWAVRRTLEVTSNHPRYIHLFCRTLLDCCAYKSPLTPPDVEEALRQLLDAPIEGFVEVWDGSMASDRQVLSVFSALRGHGGIATQYELQMSCARYGYSVSIGDLVTALNRMAQRGVLEKLGTNSYRFRLELFRLWVAHHHPPEEVFRRRPWGLDGVSLAAHLTALRYVLSRRWLLWAGLAIIVLVVMLQPMLCQGTAQPVAMPSQQIASPTEEPAVTASPSPQSLAVVTSTPVPILPGYDVALMSRENRDAPWQLYVLDTRAGERLRLTETESNERTPKWSPDGKKLAFASDRDGNREIYVIDLATALQGADGTRLVESATLVNLTKNKAPDWQPAWSPTDDRVAFSSYRDGDWEVYVTHADGTDLVRLTEHPASDFSPTWSPDGERLLFVSRRQGDADLFVLDLGTGELEQLTKGELSEYDPSWSPDGKWIAFVTQIGDQSDISVMRADGSNPVNVTNSAYANDFQPTWTPDSQWLVYVSYTTAEGDHELYKMRPDGSNVTKLTDDDYDNLAPSWRPAPQ